MILSPYVLTQAVRPSQIYREVLKRELPYVSDIERAKQSQTLPVVFNRTVVKALLAHMTGTHHLIASLLYGAGLRVAEALRLRVKDIDFQLNQMIYTHVLNRGGRGVRSPLESVMSNNEQLVIDDFS